MSQKKAKNSIFLVFDHREKDVVPFIDTECRRGQYVQQAEQLSVGDYHICRAARQERKSALLACAERKTYPDFAASFKDGRYTNVNKMLALRKKHGCQLYFFIEGPAFPSLNRKFSRIPYSNILSAITKLMVRHGIMIVQTENQAHTAKRLCDIMRAMEDEEDVFTYPCEAPAPCQKCGGAVEEKDSLQDYSYLVPEASMEKVEESDDDAIIKVWAQLRGISVVLGKIVSQDFSVMQLARGEVSPEHLRGIKTITNRTLNSDALSDLLAVRNGNEEKCVKLLSGVKGISPKIAKALIGSAGGLSRLCSYKAGTMSIIQIPHGSKTVKLGEPRAKRILHMLSYIGTKGAAADPQDGSEQVAAKAAPGPKAALRDKVAPSKVAVVREPSTEQDPVGYAARLIDPALVVGDDVVADLLDSL